MSESVKRVDKPWGYELHWAKTDRYVGKVIHVDAGHALSLQYHNQKDETIFLWSGRMQFEIQEDGKLVAREMKVGRVGARHARHGPPHDGDRPTATSSRSPRRSSTTWSGSRIGTGGRRNRS